MIRTLSPSRFRMHTALGSPVRHSRHLSVSSSVVIFWEPHSWRLGALLQPMAISKHSQKCCNRVQRHVFAPSEGKLTHILRSLYNATSKITIDRYEKLPHFSPVIEYVLINPSRYNLEHECQTNFPKRL